MSKICHRSNKKEDSRTKKHLKNKIPFRFSELFRRNSDDAAFRLLDGLAVGFRPPVMLAAHSGPDGGASAQTTTDNGQRSRAESAHARFCYVVRE